MNGNDSNIVKERIMYLNFLRFAHIQRKQFLIFEFLIL